MKDKAQKTLDVAVRVSALLQQNHIKCMVIGAAALAVHGYARQSVDLDLATYIHPFEKFKEIAEILRQEGYTVEFFTPDSDDPLGGVMNITGSDFEPVQIVNFFNPLNRRQIHRLVGEALAEIKGVNSKLCVISPELLVALKLFAGDSQSLSDISKLIEVNSDIDHAKIAELANIAGLEKEWQRILNLKSENR